MFDAEKFWSRVAYGDDCWEWTKARTTTGYGKFYSAGKHWRAHRVAYELTHGAIPDGLLVLHRCDNRLCVKPDHLFLGDYRDNILDCMAKGRWSPPPVSTSPGNGGRRTHCQRGHPLEGANLLIEQERDRLHRRCRACRRERKTIAG